MVKTFAILLMILCPLAWGLLIEYLFELRRRRCGKPVEEEQGLVE